MCQNNCCYGMYRNMCLNLLSCILGIASAIGLLVLGLIYANNQTNTGLVIGLIIMGVVFVGSIVYCAVGSCVTGDCMYCGNV